MTQPELYSKRIIKVIPRVYGPITVTYAVADSDLIKRALMPTDTDMIEVVSYDLRDNTDLVYVAAVKDLVCVSEDGYIPNFSQAVLDDERQAFYSISVMDTKLLSKISLFESQHRYVPLFAIVKGWNKNLFESALRRMDHSSLLMQLTHICSDECAGDTVLHQIVRFSRIEFFRSLVTIRPELMRPLANMIGNAGAIPLHRAIINDNTEMIDTLLTYTSPISTCKSREDSNTVLDDALLKGNDRIVSMILNDGYWSAEIIKASPELLHNAARRPYSIFKPVFKAFVAAGLSTTTVQCGLSFFTLMIQLRNSDCIVQLIRHPSFDTNILTEPDSHGNRALHWAARDGLHTVCDVLYSIYAAAGLLLAKNDKGQTALTLAAQGNPWFEPELAHVNYEATTKILQAIQAFE